MSPCQSPQDRHLVSLLLLFFLDYQHQTASSWSLDRLSFDSPSSLSNEDILVCGLDAPPRLPSPVHNSSPTLSATISPQKLSSQLTMEEFIAWMEKYAAQLVTLAVQVAWTASVEGALETAQAPQPALDTVNQALDLPADIVLQELHDVTRSLLQQRVVDKTGFTWLYQMRFYLDKSISSPLDCLAIRVADATFPYGWEYLGVLDRLFQTWLTDHVYLTLTQALDNQLGGAPFGPAGTGKTESVKGHGVQLGQFVLVFCCDENFDFKAMGHIFVERINSAVSQKVWTIQQGLATLVKNHNTEIELVGKNLKLNQNIGIFITINPTYTGCSQLPPNLTKLFRPIVMTRPDRELIAGFPHCRVFSGQLTAAT
ncbi:hypothetical protein BT96DRAFT_1005958 [Gymnopus androsaceus JB14]|uniref:Dynein heavy chain hydrolytic ATP-binding dynein motor region domain-containing protein n=1 Tax=Gymnopus androsaceus JB14 TaxID=1447944 RepID=A0A6A4GMN0_9AGAR|nr:hypothetical protein BT96DRAFT_1005958 [Gymnopus androsaceus JB14]